MACLRRRKECTMFCSSTSCCGGGQDTAGTIITRGNNAFATDEAGLVKSLAD